MKFKHLSISLTFLLSLLILGSCASKKDIVYLQGGSSEFKVENKLSYEPTIQADDVLMISVSAENQEVVAPYNLYTFSFAQANANASTPSTTQQLQNFIVDKEGNIFFPIFGKIKIAGMTRLEAIESIKKLLLNDLKNPTINLRILNFKVSVLGEVMRPGVQNINSERITILEAISQAGDLTIHAERKNIKLIREKDGVRSIHLIDLTDTNLINSPYYYLSQNDVIYVEPNKVKVNSSAVGPNVQAILYGVSIFTTLLIFTLRTF